jgi:hypothetical protein
VQGRSPPNRAAALQFSRFLLGWVTEDIVKAVGADG